jgi:hypothetical protein
VKQRCLRSMIGRVRNDTSIWACWPCRAWTTGTTRDVRIREVRDRSNCHDSRRGAEQSENRSRRHDWCPCVLGNSTDLPESHQTTVTELQERLPLVSPSQFPVVRSALLPYKDRVTKPLWDVALDTKRDVRPRLEAACALATFAPNDSNWKEINTLVAGRLVTLEASALVAWREALRPAKEQLIEPLPKIYRDAAQKEQSRIYAAETLADYVSDRLDKLFDLLADAELFQFPVMLATVAAHKEVAVPLAHEELAKQLPESAGANQRERLAKRQANMAVALFDLGAPGEVWPRFARTPDPSVRSVTVRRTAS